MGTSAYDVVIRPMLPADLAVVETDPVLLTHLLATDPEGCWVADSGGTLLGHIASCRRETTWLLASYATDPMARRAGVGGQLLDAAGQHARGCLRAMTHTHGDQQAVRALRAAGFALHPLMTLAGVVDRALLPFADRVRTGTERDLDLLDSLARRRRDSAHGPDHAYLSARYRLLVVDRPGDSGFVYLDDGGPVLLAATHRRTARDLLWAALAEVPHHGDVVVERITGANQWALEVGLEAGLALRTAGYLGLRGLTPPAPYLPHPDLL